MKNNRISSIDSLRFLSILAVISIHVNASYTLWSNKNYSVAFLSPFLNNAYLFAVPLFFIISGYFFGRSFLKNKDITKIYQRNVQKLLFIYIAWAFIYSFPHLNKETWVSIHQYGWLKTYYWHLQYIISDKVLFLITGFTWHLWFLMALIVSLTTIFLFIRWKKEQLLFILGLALYICSPLINLYLPTPNDYQWSPYIGILTSLAPILVGWWLSKHEHHSFILAVTLITLGFIIYFLRNHFLSYFYQLNSGYGNFDFLLIGGGIVLLAILKPSFTSGTILPVLGRYTMGVYCAHMLVLYYVKDLSFFTASNPWIIVLPLFIYLGSLALTIILGFIPGAKQLVDTK